MFLSDKLISCNLFHLKLNYFGCPFKNANSDQLEDHLQTSKQVTDSLTLTSTRDLGFKCLVVDMALYYCRRSHCKFSGLKWFAIFVVLRPLPKH